MILKALGLVAVAAVLTAANSIEQNDPRRVTARAEAAGPNIKVILTYQLTGGPDSVINRIVGSGTSAASSAEHRLLAAGPAMSGDSFLLARPAIGVKVCGDAYVKTRRRGLYSQEVKAPPPAGQQYGWCWTEPDQAPPPPIVNPPVVDTTAFFDDSFSHAGICKRGSSVQGFGWGNTAIGTGDSAYVTSDPASPSGCAFALVFAGDASPSADAWVEPNFNIGLIDGARAKEIFIGFIMKSPSNYFHRDTTGPANNKGLRLWDYQYSPSMVHLGFSTLPKAGGGSSVQIVEFSTPSGTGNYATGPWKAAWAAGIVDTVGFYAKVSSGVNVPDGVIKVWWNRVLIYSRDTLRLTKKITTADSLKGYNGFGHGYLLGWANSGYWDRTEMHVWRFLIARNPPAWFLPAS